MKTKTKTKSSDRLSKTLPDPLRKTKDKKKKTSTELVVSSPANKLTRKEKTTLDSYFGDHSEKILQMIEMNDHDGAMTLLKKKLLQTTVDILPYAEDILRGSGTSRGTYQYVTLVSQIRELISDIQADQDRRYLARTIADNILRPAFMDVAQTMITEHHAFKTRTSEFLNEKHTKKFNDMTMELAQLLARKMNDVYREVEAKMFEALKN
jgi:hypothetical protein